MMNLTPHEVEMLKMLSEGLTQKEMADVLAWSPSAIHRQLRNRVYPALDAANAAQAVYQAVKRGVIR